MLVSDAADLSVPVPTSAHTTCEALENDAICEVHLESDFATLHSSTPGEQLLEVVALPEGRRGQSGFLFLMPGVSSTCPPPWASIR